MLIEERIWYQFLKDFLAFLLEFLLWGDEKVFSPLLAKAFYEKCLFSARSWLLLRNLVISILYLSNHGFLSLLH